MMEHLFLLRKVKLQVNILGIFTLQAFIEMQDCDSSGSIIASDTAATSFGAPEPVRNARVIGATSAPCVMEWERDDDYDPYNLVRS